MSKLEKLSKKPLEESEERRYSEPNAKYIEEFIPYYLLDEWLVAKVALVNAFHIWKAI